MNSYGDPQSARARARVPGPSAASTPDDDPSGSRFADDGSPGPDAYRRNVSGAVPRGAASVGGTTGRASVGGAPAGRASVGSARVGARAAVGEGGAGAYGGRASVARAAVPIGSSYDELGNPTPVSGGPGAGKGGKQAKRRRRGNILTAAAAVVVILLGAGVVAGTWFFDDVQLTEPKAEVQVTQILASDGKTSLATVGKENRQLVPYQSMNPIIGQAVMAAEDKNFLDHNGIDMKGIMRAAWNNFTGGDTQGASTITQQYARHAAELKEISYNRKLREAVIARKMEDVYSKDEILGNYLNSVYFGRGAYGIEAAVKAYFGSSRSSLTQPGKKGAITAAEAAVLASVIKQPEPSATHKGYDPQNNLPDATTRWNYTLGNMVEKGWLNAAEKPTAYPKFAEFDADKCRTGCGVEKPSGKIIKYVRQELLAMGITQEEWNKGGLQIVTTIDSKVQQAAEDAAAQTSKKSPLNDLGKTYKSALVAIDPDNGRVLGYYGGDNKGDGWDYAGPNIGADGTYNGGGRPPGSSFKIYTLLAALSAGYSFDTTWDSDAKKADGTKINNSNRTKFQCDKNRCPLDKATVESYNFPFYWLADKLGPAKVIEAAHKAGVRYIGSPSKIGARVDLDKSDKDALGDFGNEVGFGQYSITALDHANGVATLAAGGVYNKAHFVKSVNKRDVKTGKFKAYKNEKLDPKEAFSPDVVAAIDHVLQKIPGANGRSLKNGVDAIGKTGTWEYKDGKSGKNGDAWMVGGTRNVAATVWVGNERPKNGQVEVLPIVKPGGGNMTGGSVPGQIWKQFMDAAIEALGKPKDNFPPDVKVGNPEVKGNGLPAPEPPPNPGGCVLGGLICPPDQNNGGNNNGGNQGQPGQGQDQPGQGQGQPGTTLPGGTLPGDTNDQGGGQNNQNNNQNDEDD